MWLRLASDRNRWEEARVLTREDAPQCGNANVSSPMWKASVTWETSADVSCTKTGYNFFQLHKHPNKRKQQPTLTSSFFFLLNGTHSQLCSSICRHNNSSATSRWCPGPPPGGSSFSPPPSLRSGGLRPRRGAIAEARPAPPFSPPPGQAPAAARGE